MNAQSANRNPNIQALTPNEIEKRARVSVLLPTFNNEKSLRRCLVSIQWADEIFVVDSFSTDRTLDICREFGARILQHEYINSAKQKNWAIPQCSHEWVLQIDSDEELAQSLTEEIQQVLQRPLDGIDGFEIPFKHFILGDWLLGVGYYPDYHLRLFRKSKGRFEDKEVHARVQLPGRVLRLEQPIFHYDATTISKWLHNLDRYTRYEADEKVKQQIEFSWFKLLLYPWGAFLAKYIRLGGFRHGFRGFFVSAYVWIYVFLKYAKLWEKKWKKQSADTYDFAYANRVALISKWLAKLDRYTGYEVDEELKSGRSYHFFDPVVRPLGAFIYHFIWRRGFAGGFRGYFVSVYSAIYVFFVYAKLWERRCERATCSLFTITREDSSK